MPQNISKHDEKPNCRSAFPIATEMAKVYHVVPVAYDSFPTDEPEPDYSFFARIHMYLRYGIKGTVDKNLSRNLSALKQQGLPG